MKTRITLIFTAILVSLNVSFAQQDEECMNNLQIFSEFAKKKNYDEAYKPWMAVRTKCPKFNRAIYQYGEKILDDKINKTTGDEQVAFINDLIAMYDQAMEYYPQYYKKGDVLSTQAQLMYDYQDVLKKDKLSLYNAFDKAYTEDKDNFTNPKRLYTYFATMVDLFDAKQKTAQEMFDKYDDLNEKIESEVSNYSALLNKLIEKEEAGQALTGKEPNYKRSYESFLNAYDQISGGMDRKLGDRANCEVLIPLYERDFEQYKNDAVWLKRSVNRMYAKECTDDALYIKLVKAYDAAAPSSDTKVFVADLLMKDGKESEAFKYLQEAYDLETDPVKKGNRANKIAITLKNKGRLSQARTYFENSLKLNPSNGRPHLSIANMYAASANNCGDTNFKKRAVFWLAAQEAAKAGRVDPTLRSLASQTEANYMAKAPSKGEIFQEDMAGKTINIGCWIGRSITVPSL